MIIEKSKTVAFTVQNNSRSLISDKEALSNEIETIILEYYSQGFRYFMTEMGIGFNLWAAEAVLKLKLLYSGLKLIAVEPFPEHSKYYDDLDKQRYDAILNQCDKHIVISDRCFAGCYDHRDDFLINNSSCVIAYFDGIKRGGTCYTVERAKSLKMPLSNVFESVKATLWWENLSVVVKSLFSSMDCERASSYHYRIFWKKVESGNRILLFEYWKYRKGMIELSEDEAHSLQMEVISELCEIKLEFEFGIPSNEMYNDDGNYFEVFQDRFNDLYDDLEDRLLEYQF